MILAYIFIFGAIIGSFLNCLIWRLHTGESMWDRSYCPKCKAKIAWYDNIPILSFLVLRGKCRKCENRISVQYPIVEFVTGALFVALFLVQITNYKLQITNEFILELIRNWLLVCFMIIIFVYDLRWYLILDKVTIPAGIIFFVLNLLLGFNWLNLIILGLIGGAFFLIQFLISKGQWIGGGDIRLGLLMGIALGRLDYLILAIFAAYILGSIVGVSLIVAGKKKWGSELPLGVFLSFATVITILFGNSIINWYLNIL